MWERRRKEQILAVGREKKISDLQGRSRIDRTFVNTCKGGKRIKGNGDTRGGREEEGGKVAERSEKIEGGKEGGGRIGKE